MCYTGSRVREGESPLALLLLREISAEMAMTGHATGDELLQADEAAQAILGRTALRPRIAVVLGSGLGSFADELGGSSAVPFGEIPSREYR